MDIAGKVFIVTGGASGLGEGTTRSVLVVPTSDDDRVNGVIELGFLRPLEERDVELLELIAGNALSSSAEAYQSSGPAGQTFQHWGLALLDELAEMRDP